MSDNVFNENCTWYSAVISSEIGSAFTYIPSQFIQTQPTILARRFNTLITVVSHYMYINK